LSWEIHFGPITDNLHVLHNCPDGDNPTCVNPSHLWLGTQGDNNRDMTEKGRHGMLAHPELAARGERNGFSRLTETDITEIRLRYSLGRATQTTLAAEYGVSQSHIWRILHSQAWKHIK